MYAFGVKGQNASKKQETCIHINEYVVYSRITKLKERRKESQKCLKYLLWVRFFLL